MGNVRGRSSHKYYDRRVSLGVRQRPCSSNAPSSRGCHFGKDSKSPAGFCSKMVKVRCNSGGKDSDSTPLFPSFYDTKEKRKVASHNRPVNFKPSSNCSYVPYGDSFSDLQIHLRRSLGLLCGHRRCLLSRPYGLGLSQIPCLQTLGKDICVSVPPIWSESGTLGVHEGNKTHKETSSSSPDSDFFVSGRLHPVRQLPNSLECGHGGDFVTSAIPRIQSELGEIKPSPSSGGGVFGRVLGFERLFSLGSPRQTSGYYGSLQRDVSESFRYKKRIGKFDRLDQFRRFLCCAGQTSSSSHHDVGKSPHSTMFQGRVCSSRWEIQGIVGNLDVSRFFRPSGSYAHPSTFSHLDDRRFFGRLVWNLTSTEGNGFLGSGCFPIIYELERTQSNPSVTFGVPVDFERQDSSVVIRQHHRHLLSEEARVGEICSPSLPLDGYSGILQRALDCFASRTSQRCFERLGRSGVSSPSGSDRVVLGQGNVCLGLQSGTTVSSGPVRHLGECSSSPVCVPLSRRFGSGGERFQLRLESLDLHLPLSSHELLARRGDPSSRVQRVGRPDSSLLAIEGVVSPSPGPLPSGSGSPSGDVPSESDNFEGSGLPRQSVLLESSRLDSVTKPWEGLLSEDSVNIIRNNHRKGTVRQYQSIWSKFLKFLSDNRIPHHEVTVFVVMNFLSHHFVSLNRKYRTIAAYKCALAHPLFVNFGIDFKDVRFDMYMKGVFNSNPPCASAPMPCWSLNDLLSFLASDHFEPLCSKALFTVTQKALCLLLLATGRRIGEIAHLSKKHTHKENGELVTISWLPQFRPKHCDSSFQPKCPSIERLASDNMRDLWLCPVRALNTYLSMIGGGPRFSINSPLWSYNVQGLTKMLQTTVLQARQRAGDMALVPMGPHQIRKLAASYSAQMVGSSSDGELKLMERMGCSSMSVLKRVYIKEVPCLNFKCVLPVGTFIPTSVG